jgi:lipopolysaccharide export system permease protein
MIKQVDQYLGRATMFGILAVWIGLTLLMMMFNLLGELRSMRGGYDAMDVFWFVLLSAPGGAYKVFPVSALLGAMIGVGGLAAANELVAFRTAGVSRLRLAAAAMAGSLLVAIPVVIMGEWVAPVADQQARAFRLSEQAGRVIIGGPRGMWMRDGKDFVNIQLPVLTADRDQQLVNFRNIVVYGFSDTGDLQQITRADSARHDGERWMLSEVRRLTLGQASVFSARLERTPWASEVRPELLDSAVARPSSMSLRSLRNQIKYLGRNGLDDRVYQSAFWAKIAFPLSVIALVMAGMPFLFGSARHHNQGVRLFVGMSLGGLFMMLNRAVENLGEAYAFPSVLSSAAPSLLLIMIAVVSLRRSV